MENLPSGPPAGQDVTWGLVHTPPGQTTGLESRVRDGRQRAAQSWAPDADRANPRPLKGNSDSHLTDRCCVIWTLTTLSLTLLPRSVLDCQTDPLLKALLCSKVLCNKEHSGWTLSPCIRGRVGALSHWVSAWLLGRKVMGGGAGNFVQPCGQWSNHSYLWNEAPPELWTRKHRWTSLVGSSTPRTVTH